MRTPYDIAIIGAGPGGLVAARFAAKLGARVVLVERHRIGGDCTWTGCVPSKALVRAARAAHEARHAHRFGIGADPPRTNMPHVRDWLRRAIADVAAPETPEALTREGIEVLMGEASFDDGHTLIVGSKAIAARRFLICTGARPAVPDLEGLDAVTHFTYEQIFDNDRLPDRLLVVGGGPLGLELAQAYRRLGAHVAVVAPRLLPREEPETSAFVKSQLEAEGITFHAGRARSVSVADAHIIVNAETGSVSGDTLLVATGRRPNTDGLQLERAGVEADDDGIRVDRYLRTSAPHIHAAGDVIGGPQFTHVAGWQCFQAVRNALLPGRASGVFDAVPWTTFLEPEVARIGQTEAEARARYGAVLVHHRDLRDSDRAVCDGETAGFIKIVSRANGRILGATIVATRAGEMISEIALVMRHGISVPDLASTMHVYPAWSITIQQLASDAAVSRFVRSWSGRLALRLGGLRASLARTR